MKDIATSLVQLTHLELSQPTGMVIEDLAQLSALLQLQRLLLRRYRVPASQLSKLGRLPISRIEIVMEKGSEADVSRWLQLCAASLQELVFCIPNYLFSGSPPLKPLQHAPLLRSLTVVGMQPNLTHLGALTQLTALRLTACGLDDAGVQKLARLSELQILDLWGNKGISGAGGSMEVLAKSMPHLQSICSNIDSAVAAAVAVFGREKVRGRSVKSTDGDSESDSE